MKKLKSNRLSYLAYGEVFPTEKQKKIYSRFIQEQNKNLIDSARAK